ncbi:ABC-type polysaccharide/polyol phosphate export systems, permease component [Cupriavidus sp. GA3-3]|uniref:ABC transporter permease n=1 Tax=Cupriavidus sp. GA3-3 TaxID=1229514 RepID=UPI00032DFE3B|nr:ABC transporter permease [Cupriavidus sp. GA3-3]EON17245.1 ABC-type polysaccharide/polyol phosphate export systems, permease component [Cupriavidus sp. GA3-3]
MQKALNVAERKVSAEPKPETLITPQPDSSHYWRDLWRFRELLMLLVWRDVLVRYKQTAMGMSWAVLRPLTTMLVFTLVFGKLAKLPSNDAPYALLVFAGMLPWQFFSATFSDAGNSVVGNGHIISKVYFPRLIVPLSALFVGVVDFVIAGVVYLGLSLVYLHIPSWQIIFLPLFVILLCSFVLACSLWVASLNVSYRDFRFLVPVAIQLGAYLSPVGFASSIVPEKWRLLYSLNPMVGIIDGFRWCLLGGQNPLHWEALAISVGITIVLLIPGIRFFRRTESGFADLM